MHKKAIALLSAALVIASMFAACEKHSRYGKVIVDSIGMEHVIMTDKDGVTVCDANGNLVEIMTDSKGKPIPIEPLDGSKAPKGEYQTHPVTFPKLVEKGNVIEDAFCKVTVPDGWTYKTTGIVLTHAASDAQVTVTTDEDMLPSEVIDNARADCKKIGVTCEEGVDTLGGLSAQTLVYNVDGILFRLYAVRSGEGRATSILCIVDESKASLVNFDDVLQSIQIK